VDVPILDEAEWAQVHPLTDTIANILQFLRATSSSLKDAKFRPPHG
jgi:hypothetical protein